MGWKIHLFGFQAVPLVFLGIINLLSDDTEHIPTEPRFRQRQNIEWNIELARVCGVP